MDFSKFEPAQRVELRAADTFVEAGGQGAALDGRVAVTFVIEDTEPIAGTVPTTLGPEPAFGAADAINEVSGFADITPMSRTLLQVKFAPGSSRHVFPDVDYGLPSVMGQGPIPS